MATRASDLKKSIVMGMAEGTSRNVAKLGATLGQAQKRVETIFRHVFNGC
jgi:hypothetical protein